MTGTRAIGAPVEDLIAAETPALLCLATVLTDDQAAAPALVEDALARGAGRWTEAAGRRSARAAVAADVVAGCRRLRRQVQSGRWRRSAEPSGLYDTVRSDEPTPDRVDRPASDPVWEAFTDLGPDERAVVALHCRAGFSNAEILRALGGRVLWPRRTLVGALDDIALTSGHHPDRIEGEVAAALRRHDAAEATVASVVEAVRRRTAGVPLRPARPRAGRVVCALAVLVAIAAATAYVRSDDSTGRPTASTLDPTATSAPAGQRLVGFGTVMLAVPRSWGYNRTDCGRPVRDTVIFPDADPPTRCHLLRGDRRGRASSRWSSVTFTAAPSNALVLKPATETDGIAGERVFASPPTRRAGLWERVVVVPGAGVQVVVRSPQRAVLSSVLDSLQSIPRGYGAVPVCVRQPIGQAIAAVERAGLAVSFTQASTLTQRYREPPVTHQTVQPGRVVPVATVVGLGFPSTDD